MRCCSEVNKRCNEVNLTNEAFLKEYLNQMRLDREVQQQMVKAMRAFTHMFEYKRF